jgi:hypothetical protein
MRGQGKLSSRIAVALGQPSWPFARCCARRRARHRMSSARGARSSSRTWPAFLAQPQSGQAVVGAPAFAAGEIDRAELMG